METAESLKRRIKTAEDLHSIVRTMKALAAVNVRQLEHAVESLADYYRTVELGLRAVVNRRPPTPRREPRRAVSRCGAIVFGTDQGMCGPLNDQIVDYTLAHIDPQREYRVLAVGSRVAGRLEDQGKGVHRAHSIATSLSGITPLVYDILIEIEAWHSQEHVERVDVFFSEHLSRASYRVRSQQLFPIDQQWLDQVGHTAWPTNQIPLITMDIEQLFAALIHQYLFVSLYRACAESMASENASRLAAMRGAERNIGDRISELTLQFHQQRQMAITEELLDIASGFEALASGTKSA